MRSQIRITKILLMFSTLILVSSCSKPLTEAEHIARAKQFQEKGDLRATMIELKDILQQNPKNIEARHLLGEIHLKLGNGAAAEKELKRAISLGLTKDAVLLPLAEALQLQGKHQEILNEIDIISSLPQPEQAILAAYRGDAWLALNKPEKAMDEYKRSLELDPTSPRGKLGLAYLAAANSNIDTALSILDEALKNTPNEGRLWRYKAELHQRRGDLEASEHAYTKALEYLPVTPSVRANRALVRIELKQFDKAVEDIEILRKIAPRLHLTHFSDGYLKFAQGKIKEAKSSLENALSLNNNYPLTNFYLGLIHLYLGELEQADARLTRFKTMMPNLPQTHQLLAMVKYRLKDYDAARKLLIPVLLSQPEDIFSLNLMANIELASGHPKEGLEYLQKIAKLKPESGLVKARLGTGLLAAGLKEEGLSVLKQALAKDPTLIQPNVLLARIYIQEKDFVKAKDAISRLKASISNHPLPYNLEAMWHMAQGNEAKARTALEQAWQIDPGNPNTGENLARLAFKNKQYDKARLIYQEVLRAHPDSVLAQLRLAEIDFHQGHFDSMKQRLMDLIQTHPNLLQPRLKLARYYLNTGHPKLSQSLLEEIRPHHSNSPNLLAILTEAQIENRQGRRALDTAKSLEKLAPNSPLTYYLLAQTHALNGDSKNMLSALNKSLALDPDFLPARLAKVKFLAMVQRASEARQEIENIVDHHPNNPEVLAMKGWLEMRQHNFGKAAESYRKALSLSRSSSLISQLATAQWRAGNREGALKTLEAWNQEHPEDVRTHYLRSIFYQMLGQQEEAIVALKRALDTNPDDAQILNDLAWLLRKRDPEHALAYAEKAYAQAPRNAKIIDTLAMTALENGETKRAFSLLEKAVELAPGNPSIRYHLALVQKQVGDRQQALVTLRQALASKQAFRERQAAQRLESELINSH